MSTLRGGHGEQWPASPNVGGGGFYGGGGGGTATWTSTACGTGHHDWCANYATDCGCFCHTAIDAASHDTPTPPTEHP